jgi:hypothetical protein
VLTTYAGNFLLCAFLASNYCFKQVCGVDINKNRCIKGKDLMCFLEKPLVLCSSVSVKWAKTNLVCSYFLLLLLMNQKVSESFDWFSSFDIVYMHNIAFTAKANENVSKFFTTYKGKKKLKILITTEVNNIVLNLSLIFVENSIYNNQFVF